MIFIEEGGISITSEEKIQTCLNNLNEFSEQIQKFIS
jgi:hypothetical protein